MQPFDLCQFIEQLLADAVAEVILVVSLAQIDEGKNGNAFLGRRGVLRRSAAIGKKAGTQ